MIDLNNTQCPACKTSKLKQTQNDVKNDAIYDRGIICNHCGKAYAVIWGVPYLGTFRQEEILSLIEIAASSNEYSISKKAKGNDYMFWINLVE
ncbi:MAG: hypothetical protein ABFR82_10170, partial [Nitrospirota bacterium]